MSAEGNRWSASVSRGGADLGPLRAETFEGLVDELIGRGAEQGESLGKLLLAVGRVPQHVRQVAAAQQSSVARRGVVTALRGACASAGWRGAVAIGKAADALLLEYTIRIQPGGLLAQDEPPT
jgi:hypothetical protein